MIIFLSNKKIYIYTNKSRVLTLTKITNAVSENRWLGEICTESTYYHEWKSNTFDKTTF